MLRRMRPFPPVCFYLCIFVLLHVYEQSAITLSLHVHIPKFIACIKAVPKNSQICIQIIILANKNKHYAKFLNSFSQYVSNAVYQL